MNIHHLELFYYVARHGGIQAACRNMPYGVQQPAVSAQILRLEEDLGVRLFERRPFRLTEAGRVLYEFAAPFFGRLPDVEAELRGTVARRLRLAGPTQVLRDHLPVLLHAMRKELPGLQLKLVETGAQGAVELLERGEIDLAVVVLEEKPPPGVRSSVLIRLPMELLVRSRDRMSVAKLLKSGSAGELDLIALPPQELLPRLFSRTLRRRGMDWPVAMEVNSMDLVAQYVAQGLGVGLAAQTPGRCLPEGVEALSIPGFPKIPVLALWKGKPPAVAERFLEMLKSQARKLAD